MKKKIVITALISTIICTCIFVIRNNNKTDIESEDSDYVYGVSSEDYNNIIDNLRTAENYNLGVIRVIEFQDGRIGRTYRYTEGIGELNEAGNMTTHDIVENVNYNLELTGEDRLCVEDVVNSEDKSLTGSDKVREIDEEIAANKKNGNSVRAYYYTRLKLYN